MANELTWHDVLAEEKQQPYFLNTLQTVASERQSGVTIYPPQKDVFNAFRFTELGDVKVVILGQDPYHGPGQAHGLAFSVRPGIAIPPSLLNMYKELENTIPVKRRTKNAKTFHDKCENFTFRASNETAAFTAVFLFIKWDHFGYG